MTTEDTGQQYTIKNEIKRTEVSYIQWQNSPFILGCLQSVIILIDLDYRNASLWSSTFYIYLMHSPFLSYQPLSVSSALTFATLPGTRKRRKRYRTIFSEMQIQLLEGLFRVTQYPDLYQRENVAFKAGLQEERVEVKWGIYIYLTRCSSSCVRWFAVYIDLGLINMN